MSLASNNDTIAAIATAPGEAAVAIVRVSGPEAFAIADRLVVCRLPKPSARPPGSFLVGHVRDPRPSDAAGTMGRDLIDEVVLLLFHAPHSFTRQDVVEFQCHGGHLAAQRILRSVMQQGARPAAAGEFTRRAFVNGRIDLIAAEAVIDLIRAQTLRAANTASEQLTGSLSTAITDIYDNMCVVLAEIEARLDFPEETLPPLADSQWQPQLLRARSITETLLATWDQGRMVRHGAVVVIAGAANVGKSTLLNALLGHERAIVSPIPGTTRDSIEAGFQINGIPIRLIDTAGYRESDCLIERDGMARTDRLRRQADGIIYLIDASQPTQAIDAQYLSEAPPDHTLLIFNKTDRGIRVNPADYPALPSIFTALTEAGQDLERIRQSLAELFQTADAAPSMPVMIGERHRDLLSRTRASLDEVQPLLESGDAGHVPATIVLRDGLDALDECLGRTFNERVLDSVFSTFCIGK